MSLGVNSSGISELKSALDYDSSAMTKPGLGHRTTAWLKELGRKSGNLALGVGVEVAKKEATKWILGYLGLHS